jgi:hypothetical protein
VEYHHVVFTVPSEVNRIGLSNPVSVYEALLSAAAEAIRVVAADPKHLGAEVGVLLVLHTWGQTLSYHPHAHAVVTGGGLSPEGRWRACRPGFFLPVRVLSRVFRGIFLARIRAAFTRGTLIGFANGCALEGWVRALVAKDWVVYAKAPFGGPSVVLKYLARYTHRVAIANARLVKLDGDRVTFTYKDYADAAKSKELTLSAVEFVRRWAQHVLPRRFVKIRHYGLLANRHREQKLAVCRRLLLGSGCGVVSWVPEPVRVERCPVCGCDVWVVVARLCPGEPGGPVCRSAARVDSS